MNTPSTITLIYSLLVEVMKVARIATCISYRAAVTAATVAEEEEEYRNT